MGLPEYPLQFQNPVAGVSFGPSVSNNIRFQDRGEVGERMQASMFNVCVPLDETGQGGDVFLMNTFTDAQLIVSREVADLLDRVGESNVPETDEQREALATLAEHGFIVGDREGERVKLEKYFRNIREGHEQLRVTVLTTLQCNFACDYCFQGDHGDYNKFAAKMTLETRRARGGLGEGTARRAAAANLRADALWRRTALEPSRCLLPRRAALEGVGRARRAHARERHHQRAAPDARGRRSTGSVRTECSQGHPRWRSRHAQSNAAAQGRSGHLRQDH